MLKFLKFKDARVIYKAYIFNDILIFKKISNHVYNNYIDNEFDKILKKYNIIYYRYYDKENTWLTFNVLPHSNPYVECSINDLKRILYNKKFKNKFNNLLEDKNV